MDMRIGRRDEERKGRGWDRVGWRGSARGMEGYGGATTSYKEKGQQDSTAGVAVARRPEREGRREEGEGHGGHD